MSESAEIDGYLQPEFTLNEVHFRIEKLSAMEGFSLFEQIRKEIAQTLDSVNLDESDADAIAFMKGILQLEPAFVARVRTKLFEHVQFKGSGADNFVKLGGAEDMAFKDLEPIDIYEVLLRCLIVNFIGSFRAMRSKSESLSLILKS